MTALGEQTQLNVGIADLSRKQMVDGVERDIAIARQIVIMIGEESVIVTGPIARDIAARLVMLAGELEGVLPS